MFVCLCLCGWLGGGRAEAQGGVFASQSMCVLGIDAVA